MQHNCVHWCFLSAHYPIHYIQYWEAILLHYSQIVIILSHFQFELFFSFPPQIALVRGSKNTLKVNRVHILVLFKILGKENALNIPH